MFKTYSCYLIIGQLGIRKSILFIVMITSLASMGLTSNQANGGNMVGPIFDDNFVHAEWLDPSPILIIPSFFDSFSSSGLQLFDLSPILLLPAGQQGIGGCIDTVCEFIVTNFVDDLDRKIIQIDISWGPPGTPVPGLPIVLCNVSTTGRTQAQFVDGNEIDGFAQLTFDCEPNPDWEEISFEKDPATIIQSVQIWTTSFDDILIGGTLIPIDRTSLLLAGAQMTAVWMIPVIVAGAGIGLVFVRKSKNS